MSKVDGVFMFSRGEEVEVKSTGKIGTVEGRRCEEKEVSGVITPVIEYHIKLEGNRYNTWFKEQDLNPALPLYEEIVANDILINAHLAYGSLDTVRHLHNEKQELLKKVNSNG